MPRPLPPRSVIDRYMIENVFADSKAGIAYLAEDMKIGRRVLLTEFFPADEVERVECAEGGMHCVAPKDAEAFHRKKAVFAGGAQRFSEREHPGCIKVIRTFETNGTAFSAAEYGGELPFDAYFSEEQLVSEAKLFAMLSPLFNFLKSLHNRGEVYKDLCPENLLVRKNGALVLAPSSLPFPPVHEGYSPPEQYAYDGTKLTPKSDVYAVGALLYRIITGTAPATSRQRTKALVREEADPYVPLEPGRFSEDLCRLVNGAVSLDAEARPASIYAMEAVMQAPEENTARASENSMPVQTPERRKKTSPLRLGAIVAAAVVVYVLLINSSPLTVSADDLSRFDIVRYRWAALWGDANAQKALGHIYESGIGVAADREEAMGWYKKAADAGDYDAMVILDDMRTAGSADAAGQSGPEPARYAERIRTIEKNNPHAVFQRYYEQAQTGGAHGLYNLGAAYANGIGVPVDQVKASYYLLKAAEKGDTDSQMWMGYRYFYGRGVAKNEKSAAEYFKKAAQKGDAASMGWLGYLHAKGFGVAKNDKQAAHWYLKAAKAGRKVAAYNLGNCYKNGRGVPRDIKKAIYWYERSAEKGYRDAMRAMGKIYYHGRGGIKRDDAQARRWFEQAAKLNDPQAKKYLAKMDRTQKNTRKTSVHKTAAAHNTPRQEAGPGGQKRASNEARHMRQIEASIKVERERRIGFLNKTYPRFIDRGAYVQDTKTGLLWQKDGRRSGRLNYYQAGDYAKALTLGGLLGWRVPTREELASIFPARSAPFTNTPYTSKPCCKGPYEWRSYWTSERDRRLDDYAYVYHWYGKGGANNCYASKNYDYVRAVHDPVVNTAYLRTVYTKGW
jgi:TPR repeat protein